ncbi:DUF2627 domain-containing protein [Aureibacillus halotolerans]|uniref:Uncharacterized protein DUF2627 n=1 Tax=Aureibacillus halotolerans TaxID=1508390 RepID=A0A4R6U9H9_9BACI|nr:DUF2627 domain-containing protein [Aureibacillus halotolerans]TDQ41633.1 uncharacterized protein DUF2627 [Aureibacillus halotolerans]
MKRFIALLLVCIPIISAAYGIKLLRDVLFGIQQSPYGYLWIQFFAGLFFLAIGCYLVGSFVIYRDRKNGKVPPRKAQKKAKV